MTRGAPTFSEPTDNSMKAWMPWLQLILGIVCMASIANYQYGWTLFVLPMSSEHAWSNTAITVAFTTFVVFETWLVPVEGYFIDRVGPRFMVMLGGALAGLGWVLDSYAPSLTMLYISSALCGLGAGMVYGTCVGNALKWFGKRRGLAAGLTAAGFGMGSALTVVPLANYIASSPTAYHDAFRFFGIVQGVIVIVAGLFLARPPKSKPAEAPPTNNLQNVRMYDWHEVLRSPTFYVMYAMFVMVATGGLMAVAQLAPLAKDFYVDTFPVSMLGITLPALQFALSIDRIMNGLTRPVCGWISDYLGRENTMFVIFALECVGILALWKFGTTPMAFVLLSGLVFFGWGEIYSLFPAMTRDHFGQRFATQNYGMLYTAKGTAALLVPFAPAIVAATGTWSTVLVIAAVFNGVAAVLALAVLKPLRRREVQRNIELGSAAPGEPVPAMAT
ncbi:MAG: oxalate/formate MFS antiporter [Candidatus Eremiobacteraeota bacterium]|nr:oxalate/formate MFS antiporter [Candidatus Eremiobacteraeota bacterium]